MADKKISELDPIAAVAAEDLIPFVDDPSGTPETMKGTVTQLATRVEAINTASTRTPSAHAASHATGGSDPITPSSVGAVAGPVSSVLGYIPQWNDTTGDTLNGGIDADNVVMNTSGTTSTGCVAMATDASGRLLEFSTKTAASLVTYSGALVSGNLTRTNGTAGEMIDANVPATFVLVGALGGGVSTIAVAGPTAITDGSNRFHVVIDTTTIGGNCTVQVPDTLTAQVAVDLRIEGAFGLILTPTGTQTLVYHGWTQGATITGDGVTVRIIVESATEAHVYVYPTGGSLPQISGTTGRVAVIGTSGTSITNGPRLEADLVAGPASAVASNLAGFNGTGGKTVQDSGVSAAMALDAIAPTVQSTHTSATKTIASTDANQHIPLSAASNAIAVTLPTALFAAAGAGRAFVCTFEVLSIAGGAVTFVGSGGIVITYSGKNPGTTAFAVGDFITVVITSATKARVFTSVQA